MKNSSEKPIQLNREVVDMDVVEEKARAKLSMRILGFKPEARAKLIPKDIDDAVTYAMRGANILHKS